MSATDPAADLERRERRGARGPARRVLEDDQRLRLEAAAEARRVADENYITEILAAHAAGATNASIAEAVGVTQESIRLTIKRRQARKGEGVR